jgi:hypothetical protein
MSTSTTFLYGLLFIAVAFTITYLIIQFVVKKWKCVGKTCEKVIGGDFDSLESCQQTCSSDKVNKYDCITATDGKQSCVQNTSGGGTYDDSKTCEASCGVSFPATPASINRLLPPYQRPRLVDTRFIPYQTGYVPNPISTNVINYQTGYNPLLLPTNTNFIRHQTGYNPNFIHHQMGYNQPPISTNLITHQMGYNPKPVHHQMGYNPKPVNNQLIKPPGPKPNPVPTPGPKPNPVPTPGPKPNPGPPLKPNRK